MSRVNDFVRSNRFLLGIAVGFNCVRCDEPTVGVNPTTNQLVDLGIAAHDVAASDNGPRGDANMPNEQKRDISNGAWLCRRCAAVVDIECEQYPAGTISRWQTEAANDRYYGVVGRHKEDDNDA